MSPAYLWIPGRVGPHVSWQLHHSYFNFCKYLATIHTQKYSNKITAKKVQNQAMPDQSNTYIFAFVLSWSKGHWAPIVTMERRPCKGTFQKIPGCCREGWWGEAASSCPYDKHGRRQEFGLSNTDERYQASWQMQGATQSRRVTNTFISIVTHTVSLFKAIQEKWFSSDMKGNGRKQTSAGSRWKLSNYYWFLFW